MPTPAEHWDRVYQAKRIDQVSWHRPHLEVSFALIKQIGVGPDAPILDVGAGASTLVDDLLESGFRDVTLLDVSASALAVTRERLGGKTPYVSFIVGDVIGLELPAKRFLVWHDRAAFHFFVDLDARQRYVDQVRRSLAPGGHLIIAAFGPTGPERCSGLPTTRYDAATLQKTFGPEFRVIDSREERHITPAGVEQAFVYSLLTRD
jgi:ubiquinone/menaquinone biosynthesis C-methylase UbiE